MTTRRDMLRAAPAALAAVALPAAAGATDEDAELRRLWSDYLDRFRSYRAIQADYLVAREAVDAEMPPRPKGVRPGDHHRKYEANWGKHGLDRLNVEINDAVRKVRETVDVIRATEASTIVGLGIKLAALATPASFRDDIEDYSDTVEAHDATLDNIVLLTGRTDLAVPAIPGPYDAEAAA